MAADLEKGEEKLFLGRSPKSEPQERMVESAYNQYKYMYKHISTHS